jgi:hypothetical protein
VSQRLHTDPEVAANQAYDTFSVPDILRLREPQALAEGYRKDLRRHALLASRERAGAVADCWGMIGGIAAPMFKAVAAGPPVLSGSCRLMMRDLLRPCVRTLAAATFLGSIGFVGLPPRFRGHRGPCPAPRAPLPRRRIPPRRPGHRCRRTAPTRLPSTQSCSASITCAGSCVSRQPRSRFGPVSRK